MDQISSELKAHFLRLYAMAFTDDHFHPTELTMLYDFAKARGVNEIDLKNILTNPIHSASIPESLEERIEYLHDFAVMAWADGVIVEDEKNTLKKYCKLFGILDEQLDEFLEYLLESTQPGSSISKEAFIKELT